MALQDNLARTKHVGVTLTLLLFAAVTLLPFVFVINNSFRTNPEMFQEFFGFPQSFTNALAIWTGDTQGPVEVSTLDGGTLVLEPDEAIKYYLARATRGYGMAWREVRKYMFNSLVVCAVTAFAVVLLGSVSAYVLSRYRFFGSQYIFYFIISAMMFPAVLTFVPLFMLVKEMGMIDTYWAMILPYIAGGQIFAIFVFKSFFDGLPEDLFDAARIDGAGQLQSYYHIVLPLSKPVISVVLIMNVMASWNNFLWPFVTNPEGRYHVMASGLYVLATSGSGQNYSTLFAAYLISSVPLLIIFTYATKPFIEGVTSGAFKA